VAEIVTGVFTVTAEVVMVKVGETETPPATVTEAGTVTAGLLLPSVTIAPPDGAGPVSVTVLFVVVAPPAIEAGDNVIAEAPGGKTVMTAVAGTPL